MRNLLKIVGLGLIAFIVIAMLQQWQVFLGAWFGTPAQPLPLSTEDDRDVRDTVYTLLSLMHHLYSSDGDTRFAERMPASGSVVAEMLADVEYLRRNHRRQEPELLKLEIDSLERLDGDRVEVLTREIWRVGFVWIDGSGESDPASYQIIGGRYLVVRQATGWRIEDWEFRFDLATAHPAGLSS